MPRRLYPGDLRPKPAQKDLRGPGVVVSSGGKLPAKPLNVLFFARHCEKRGCARPDMKELQFHPVREWRFDIAWTKYKVALEVNGGTWTGGRHNRGKGSIEDWLKVNEAQILGWIVIQVPRSEHGDDDWISDATVDLCARAIARQRARAESPPVTV